MQMYYNLIRCFNGEGKGIHTGMKGIKKRKKEVKDEDRKITFLRLIPFP
jgi:hypothetical protein